MDAVVSKGGTPSPRGQESGHHLPAPPPASPTGGPPFAALDLRWRRLVPSERSWEAGTQRLSGGRGSPGRRLGEEPESQDHRPPGLFGLFLLLLPFEQKRKDASWNGKGVWGLGESG